MTDAFVPGTVEPLLFIQRRHGLFPRSKRLERVRPLMTSYLQFRARGKEVKVCELEERTSSCALEERLHAFAAARV